MTLVTSASFSILLNNSPSKSFRPSRGLRQGDLISPFLFILMMEGLGKVITSVKRQGTIQGLKLTHEEELLTHQQFVDDTMLQGIPTVKEAKAYKQILHDFALAAGTEEPNLSGEGLDILREETVNKGLKKVSNFWDKIRNGDKCRTWKVPINNEEHPLKTQAKSLAKILEKRKILISTSTYQLRWGRSSEGNFNLKEAKEVVTKYNFSNLDKTWKNLWKHPQWMKIKVFMWTVLHKKILTWDNLRKRGFVGLSKCQLCGI
eukprot:PITA_02599